MPTKAPWHSVHQHVHHTNTGCAGGKGIPAADLREGTGEKPLCHECARLDHAGK